MLSIAETLKNISTILIVLGITIILLSIGVIIYLIKKNKKKEGIIEDEEII